MVGRRVLSDTVWGKEGREVMDGREEGPFRHCTEKSERRQCWFCPGANFVL